MKKLNLSIIASSALIVAALSGNVVGDAGISYNPGGAAPEAVDAKVKFKIKIPKLMILRVGDWGGTVNTVEWNYAFGSLGNAALVGNYGGAADRASEAQWDATASAGALAATGDDDADAADGSLAVAAFGNTGANLNLIATTVSDFVSTTPVAGAAQPHLSEITAADGGNITHPGLVNTGSSATPVVLTHTNGIVRLTDTWTYTYTPVATPAGGEYDAEVKYTLTSL